MASAMSTVASRNLPPNEKQLAPPPTLNQSYLAHERLCQVINWSLSTILWPFGLRSEDPYPNGWRSEIEQRSVPSLLFSCPVNTTYGTALLISSFPIQGRRYLPTLVSTKQGSANVHPFDSTLPHPFCILAITTVKSSATS